MNRTKIFLAIGLLLALSFASCKKDRTCTCSGTAVETTGSVTNSSTFSATINYEKVKKADAETKCISGTSTVTDNGTVTTITQTCTLE